MPKSVYFNVFRTPSGLSACQITKYRFVRLCAMHKQSMLMSKGVEIWFTYPRSLMDNKAADQAKDEAEKWHKQGRPSPTKLRQAIEEGRSYELFD